MLTEASLPPPVALYPWPEGVWSIRRVIKGLVADKRIYGFYCRKCLKNHDLVEEMPLLYSSRGVCQDCRQVTMVTNPHLTTAIQAVLNVPIQESDFEDPFSLASIMEDLLIPYPLPSPFLFRVKELLFQKLARNRGLLRISRLNTVRFSMPSVDPGEPEQFPAVAYAFNRYLGQLLTQKRIDSFYCPDCLTQKGFTPSPDPMMTDTGQCQGCQKTHDIENPYVSAYLRARDIRFQDQNPATDFIRDLVIPWPQHYPPFFSK